MIITREMAIISLRPDINAWSSLLHPSEQEITDEMSRLDKQASAAEKKALMRKAHPVDIGTVADELEGIKARDASQDAQIATLTTRISTLEGRKN